MFTFPCTEILAVAVPRISLAKQITVLPFANLNPLILSKSISSPLMCHVDLAKIRKLGKQSFEIRYKFLIFRFIMN